MRPINLTSLFLIILILFFSGCDNKYKDKDIVSPVVDPGSIPEPEWISLPANEDSLSEVYSVSKLVRADRQDFITLSRWYEGGELGSVSIACVIVFPPGVFKEDIYITMTIDDEKGCVTFQPEMKFNVPAKFTMILKGIDLDNVDINNADFIKFDENKRIEEIDYKKLNIDTESGTISVYEAVINQFSKYGFTH